MESKPEPEPTNQKTALERLQQWFTTTDELVEVTLRNLNKFCELAADTWKLPNMKTVANQIHNASASRC